MGLFGDTDVDSIPDDPFFVPAGTYDAVLTKWGVIKKKTSDGQGVSAQFTIEDDEAGSYDGMSLSRWVDVYPDATKEEAEVDETIRKAQVYLRQHLTQMGVPREEHATFDDFESYIGNSYRLTVTNSTDSNDPDKKYSNIQKIQALDE
jgi:hypothetical protein